MRVAFYSTIQNVRWGGSEELWSQTAAELLAAGHNVTLNYPGRNPVPQVQRLIDSGARIYRRNLVQRSRMFRKILSKVGIQIAPSKVWLQQAKPDLLLVSLSWHLDDLSITETCRSLGIPYALLVQAASPHHGIDIRRYKLHREAFAGAARVFLVSNQNREILESILALDLTNAEIVDNAFSPHVDEPVRWPESNAVWKLACVGRINFQSKGQDLLLNVLSKEKWRSRPVEATLWGADEGNLQQVRDIIELRGLQDKVKIGGFADNIREVWSEHHALVLPSRYEGNALAMIEAMLCGRVPIVTDVGRACELIDDNICGFVAPAPTVAMLDDALERAWQRRGEWRDIGTLASETLRSRHSARPARDFASTILTHKDRAQLQASLPVPQLGASIC